MIVPLVSVTVWPEEIEVELIVMSVPEVPTVRPDTITVPELSRSSALAAVPVAEADAVTPEAFSVSTPPETVPGVELSGKVASTPVAPESADVPMMRLPAVAEPVEAAAVLPAI